jgi:hypothetical protein
MSTTTSYGTWSNYETGVVGIRDTVAGFIEGGGTKWVEEMIASGAFERVVDDYRDAINGHLPDGFSLAGDDFYGPADLDADQVLAVRDVIRRAINAPDLAEIVAQHDVDSQ